MARQREISFFLDIQSDEVFEEFLAQNKLLVLDVYQDFYGPCLALHNFLRKTKVSLEDSDSLQLATCNADKIEKLKRFRKKCYPTIVFCRNAKVVDISYGANIPQLFEYCSKYIEIFRDPSQDSMLTLYEFDELLPAEKAAIEHQIREEEERIRREEKAAEEARRNHLDGIIEIMNSNASDMGITLYMPHVVKFGYRKTYEIAKKLSLVNRGEKLIQLTPEMMETLNYNLENPIDERILELIYHEDIHAVLWYTDPCNPVTDVIQQFIKTVTEPQKHEIEGEETTWETILEPLIIEPNENIEDDDENAERESKSINLESEVNDDDVSRKSIKRVSFKDEGEGEVEKVPSDPEIIQDSDEKVSEKSLDMDVESEESLIEEVDDRLKIPPIWTPANQDGNAIFMHEFFRNQFDSFLPPIIEPDPPHLCMIFPAKVYKNVMKICDEYPKELLNYGFFEGETFEDFQPVCKSGDSYENLQAKGNEKLILKIAKKTSHLALHLVTLNPLYVSQNVDEGQEECSIVFAEVDSEEEK